ncbi:UNVERIFIED_CONTAM: hypothetical protein HDU68_004506, partial [Siphonaria sp. JEL0065]
FQEQVPPEALFHRAHRRFQDGPPPRALPRGHHLLVPLQCRHLPEQAPPANSAHPRGPNPATQHLLQPPQLRQRLQLLRQLLQQLLQRLRRPKQPQLPQAQPQRRRLPQQLPHRQRLQQLQLQLL